MRFARRKAGKYTILRQRFGEKHACCDGGDACSIRIAWEFSIVWVSFVRELRGISERDGLRWIGNKDF